MKKWHMEGIVSCSNLHGRKIVVPDEDHMYHRVHNYLHQVHKESVIVAFLRDVAGGILKHI